MEQESTQTSSSVLHLIPAINVVPNTPPANQSQEPTQTTFCDLYDDGKNDDLLNSGLQSRTSTERHVHYPSNTIYRDTPSRLSAIQHNPVDPIPNKQQQILTALAVGVRPEQSDLVLRVC